MMLYASFSIILKFSIPEKTHNWIQTMFEAQSNLLNSPKINIKNNIYFLRNWSLGQNEH